MYQKIMFDRYYCIKAVSLENFGETASKMSFPCTYMYNAAERHVTWERFENVASRANDTFILTLQNYVCYCTRY